MKKLLGLLAATGLVATTSATVVACTNKVDEIKKDIDKDNLLLKNLELNVGAGAEGEIKFTSDKGEGSLLEVTSNNEVSDKGIVLFAIKLKTGELPKEQVVEKLTINFEEKTPSSNVIKTVNYTVTIKAKEAKVELSTLVITEKAITISDEVKSGEEYLEEVIKDITNFDKNQVTAILTVVPVKGEREVESKNGELTITAKGNSTLYSGSVTIELNWHE